LLDVHGRSQLFVRAKLTGTRFGQRALIPQVWVGRTFAAYVDIADDGLSVRAYFGKPPRPGMLYFGYGGKPELSFGRLTRGGSALSI